MSDRPIQKGDLVIVVKPTMCCGSTKFIGRIFTVMGDNPNAHTICLVCQSRWQNGRYGREVILSGDSSCSVHRLKRIDPPAIEGETERGEELTV